MVWSLPLQSGSGGPNLHLLCSARIRRLYLLIDPPLRSWRTVVGVPGQGEASLRHLLVEDVQVHVAEQRADDAPHAKDKFEFDVFLRYRRGERLRHKV